MNQRSIPKLLIHESNLWPGASAADARAIVNALNEERSPILGRAFYASRSWESNVVNLLHLADQIRQAVQDRRLKSQGEGGREE